MKTAKEFYNETEYPKQFTKLTSTGISNDFENVFEFAELYAKALLEEAAEVIENRASPVNGIVHEHWLSLKLAIRFLIPKEKTTTK